MTEKKHEDVREPAAAGRQPYEAPAIAWQESIESNARLMSACQKHGGDGEPCDSTPDAS